MSWPSARASVRHWGLEITEKNLSYSLFIGPAAYQTHAGRHVLIFKESTGVTTGQAVSPLRTLKAKAEKTDRVIACMSGTTEELAPLILVIF